MTAILCTVIALAISVAAQGAVVTGYCACRICCGKGARGITAAGTRPVQGRTVAGPRSVPLGTRVIINGKPYTVEDRTAKRYDGRWDIYFQSHKNAKNFGRQEHEIKRH